MRRNNKGAFCFSGFQVHISKCKRSIRCRRRRHVQYFKIYRGFIPIIKFFVWHLTGHEHGKTSGGTSIEEKEVIEIIIIMTWNEGMNDSFDTHLSRRLFQSCMVLIQSPPLYATYYCFFSSPNTVHFYFILLFSSTFVRLYLIEYLLLLNMLNIHSRYFMEVSYCCSNAWRRSEFFIIFIYVF